MSLSCQNFAVRSSCNPWPTSCQMSCQIPCQIPTPCPQPTFVTLSGTVLGVTGAPVSGFSVAYTVNGQSLSTTTDANGVYRIIVPRGTNVTVTAQPAMGVTVTPPSYSLGAVCVDRTNLNFQLSAVTPGIVTLTGTLSSGGIGAANQVVVAQVNGTPIFAITDSQGNFSFSVPSGSNVTVSPSAGSGFSPTPASYSFASLTSSQSGLNFALTPLTTGATLTGMVTMNGMAAAGTIVQYTVNGQTFYASTTASGQYSLAAPVGASVTIMPLPVAGRVVTPANYSIAQTASGTTAGFDFVVTTV